MAGKKKIDDGDGDGARKLPRAESSASAASPAAALATAAASACTPPADVAAEDFPTEDSLPHLCCNVCLTFPDGEIQQCSAGHILCRPCYDRVCRDLKPTCPTCREPLDLVRPIRNVLAEQSIALLRVACPNAGCNVALTRGRLRSHLASECLRREVTCKYAPLGCKWTGIAEGLARHEDRCKRAEQPGWKLLKKVELLAKESRAREEAHRAQLRSASTVCEMLTGRCRNVEFTHITLHKCSAHEHVDGKPAHLVSATFHALGFRWRLYTVCDSSLSPSRYSATVQLRDCRVPLQVMNNVIDRRIRRDERDNPPR